MIWGGGGGNREKKNSRGPSPGNKNFWGPLSGKKKFQAAPPRKKKFSGISLLREKKFLGPFLMGLYKEKKIFGEHLWEKKFLGNPP